MLVFPNWVHRLLRYPTKYKVRLQNEERSPKSPKWLLKKVPEVQGVILLISKLQNPASGGVAYLEEGLHEEFRVRGGGVS